MILSEYLSGMSVPKPYGYGLDVYICKFRITRPKGDVILLMWRKFHFKRNRSWYTHYVKVSDIKGKFAFKQTIQ